MSLPDFVQEVLTYLTDGSGTQENWNTSNFDPQPTLIDGDEMRNNEDDSRAKSVDIINENVITVDSSPSGTNTPIGTEFDHKIRFGVNVQIEGYHADGGGQLADKDDFNSLVTEAKRAILTEREFPTTGMTYLAIEEENDESPANDANYFRYEFDVWFHGFETLP